MKVTVVTTSGIGQIFSPVPREYSSLGFPAKALLDALTSNAVIFIAGTNAGGTAGKDLSIADKIYIRDDSGLAWGQAGASQSLASVLSSSTSRTAYDWTSNNAAPKNVAALSLQALIDAICRDDANSPTLAFRTDMQGVDGGGAGDAIAGIWINQNTGIVSLSSRANVTTAIAAIVAAGSLVELTAVAAQKWE